MINFNFNSIFIFQSKQETHIKLDTLLKNKLYTWRFLTKTREEYLWNKIDQIVKIA